jgi:(S)-mandelate dehydrogenase
MRVANAACIDDLARIARRRLPRFVFNYVAGGAGQEAGVRRNEEAFRPILFRVRRFAGLAEAKPVELFGHSYSQAFGVAPLGMANLSWPGADLALARLAQRENIPYVLSTAGTTSIERIAEAAPDVAWFQLYLSRDERITLDMIERAWQAGIRVLVLTVDVPAASRRNRGIRDGFSLPFHYTPRLIADLAAHPEWSLAMLRAGVPTLETYAKYASSPDMQVVGKFIAHLNKNGFDWDDLRKVRELWRGTLVVKGILVAEDAAEAVRLGADAIWVSNHGGRQLESAPASIDMLGDVCAEVGHAVPVLFDGGIRGGEDAIKACALGADMVFSGRCFAYGVAAGGEGGAAKAFEIISREIVAALTQMGCGSIGEAGHEFLLDRPGNR